MHQDGGDLLIKASVGESIPLVLLPGQKRKQMLRTIFPGNSLLDREGKGEQSANDARPKLSRSFITPA